MRDSKDSKSKENISINENVSIFEQDPFKIYKEILHNDIKTQKSHFQESEESTLSAKQKEKSSNKNKEIVFQKKMEVEKWVDKSEKNKQKSEKTWSSPFYAFKKVIFFC